MVHYPFLSGDYYSCIPMTPKRWRRSHVKIQAVHHTAPTVWNKSLLTTRGWPYNMCTHTHNICVCVCAYVQIDIRACICISIYIDSKMFIYLCYIHISKYIYIYTKYKIIIYVLKWNHPTSHTIKCGLKPEVVGCQTPQNIMPRWIQQFTTHLK